MKTVETKNLDAYKINIKPNTANEFVNLELKLDAVNASVAASVIDGKGQMVVGSEVEKNFQNGMMTLNVKSLPAGTYYLWIRTAEGSTMKPIVVAH